MSDFLGATGELSPGLDKASCGTLCQADVEFDVRHMKMKQREALPSEAQSLG